MKQPRFTTPRLLLVPRRLQDTEACLALDRAPGVTRFVTGPWADPAAHRAFVEARTQGPYPAGMGYWTIRRHAEPSEVIGWVLLIPEDAKGPEIEIGWRLRPEFWGQGIATEAASPILVHAFSTLHVPRLVADIMAENLGSLRLAEKLGLRPVANAPAFYCRFMLAREDFAPV